MPGRALTPVQVAEAVTLREAGYTLAAISQRLGVGVSTLHRVFARHRAKKGSVQGQLVAAARKELLGHVSSDARIQHEAARLIADDLAHAALIRDRIGIASEQLHADNLTEAVLVMRAAAAYSTALKNTSDMLRHVMRFDKAIPEHVDDALPELRILTISGDEALMMNAARMTGDKP